MSLSDDEDSQLYCERYSTVELKIKLKEMTHARHYGGVSCHESEDLKWKIIIITHEINRRRELMLKYFP